MYNNSFHNASRGVYINGGRLTSVRENYFENCDLAINFADPGTGHHKGVDQPTMGWDCACFRPCLLVCLLACLLACLHHRVHSCTAFLAVQHPSASYCCESDTA